MDDRNDESARLRRRAGSPDTESVSNGLGLGLGFGMQSNMNTMDGPQATGEAGGNLLNASMPNISAPRSTSASTFSPMGPRSSAIGGATTRGMFGGNIPMGRPAAAQSNNPKVGASSSNTAMDGVQFHGHAGTSQSRTTASSRSSSSAAGPSGSRHMSSGPMNSAIGADTPTGLPSATLANPSPPNAAAIQNAVNRTNVVSANLPPNLAATYNQLLNSINSTNNLASMASQLSASSAQLTQRLHQQYGNTPSTQPIPQLLQRRALIRAQQQGLQRATTPRKLRINNPPKSAPTTFHPFPRLPKELQLKIWKLLIPGPRIIELKPETITTTLDDESEITCDRNVSQTSHPVLLHVCHDSRHLAKKIYQLCFEEELKWPVYMDPSCDILLLPDTMALDIFASSVPRADASTPPSLAHIKYIIVDPKGIVASLPARQRRTMEHTFPTYRFEEIAATYGSLKEIVILKYPSNHHLAPLPPQLNQAGVMPRGDTAGMENHLRMLMRWSVSMRTNQPQNMPNAQPGAGVGLVPAALAGGAGGLAALAGAGAGGLGGVGAGGGVGGAGGMAGLNGIAFPPGFLNQLGPMGLGPLGGANAGAPWNIPKVVAMTLDDLKARMERGEPEEADENTVLQ